MEKILLLQPPVSFREKTFALVPNCPHLGLLYLAASLIQKGFSVSYLDASDNSISLKDILAKIEKENFGVLGVTAMTQNIKGAVQFAQFLKESKTRAKIILGGPHVSADQTIIQRFPYFDAAVTGESEITMVKLVKDLFNGKTFDVALNGETPMELDTLPFPARHLMNFNVYRKRGSTANAIFATRGCPHHCNFCSIPAIDKKVRFRSPSLIIEEMKDCVKLNNVTSFNFSDDALTINKKFVYSLCENILKLPFHIQWVAQSRVNYIDRELLRIMKKAGCYKLLFGIESGNERIRNQIIGKGITDDQIMRTTKLCWDEGIEPDHYLMVGQPTETMEEIEDTVNSPLRFNPNIIGVFLTMPLPGAPLFKIAIDDGTIEKDVIDKYVRGEYGQGYQGCWPYYIPRGLSLEQLIEARNRTYKKFYLRPNYIIKRFFRDCTSWSKLKMDFIEGQSLVFRKRSKNDFNVLNKKI